MRAFDVLIVGGGASGVLAAAQLLTCARTALRMALVDRSGRFGRGPAYGTPEPAHLLNVRARSMSVWPDDPDHFVSALRATGLDVDGSGFVSRARFGAYLERVLSDAVASAPASVTCLQLTEEIVELERDAQGFLARTRSGACLRAERVLLATGNVEPAALRVPDGGVFASEAWIASPWQAGWMEDLHPDDDVLLVGTRLTSVDVVLSLLARGHRGHITAVSRHGLLPRPHPPVAKALTWEVTDFAPKVRALLRTVRAQVERRVQDGETWQDALDALRPHLSELWRSLPMLERRRFLRHLRVRWEVLRHRMAPEIDAAINAARVRGQLEVIAGRVLRFEPSENGLSCWLRRRSDGAEWVLRARRGVNCTGPANPVASGEPLFAALVRQGLAVADPLGFGIETREGRVVDREGRSQGDLLAIGSLRRAELWESVAIPEIRVQAAEAARALLEAD